MGGEEEMTAGGGTLPQGAFHGKPGPGVRAIIQECGAWETYVGVIIIITMIIIAIMIMIMSTV